ncbi:hypothetical protein CCHR01_17957 [Colletotrichum chrysophilum]|uniref:Uncharacterized protein n=1 Tax=Colletotrichum chrysophilum TaxID=1836956 RepID=A0AAD9E9D7_9PEZI|nr:hypothetical protein CCHR01_17957 [Colletotrichum chrysophilum]
MLRALTRTASVQLRPGSSIDHLPDHRLKTKASNLDSRRKPYAAFIACGSCQILSIGVRTPRIILSLCRWLLRRSSRRVPKWVPGARLRLQPPPARVRGPASELPTAGSSEQDFQNSSARPQQQSGWSPRNRSRCQNFADVIGSGAEERSQDVKILSRRHLVRHVEEAGTALGGP